MTPTMSNVPATALKFFPGMGQAVAERTILRKDSDGVWETWCDVSARVAKGNASLLALNSKTDCLDSIAHEEQTLFYHMSNGHILMSGRHLQHGDENQATRPLEVFTNCSSAATSFCNFLLLLAGSGVGRCYDDDLMLVNWDYAPDLRCVLSETHPDFDPSAHESLRDALHKYGSGTNVVWFEVPDTREGWAKSLEIWETMAFEKVHRGKMLILDFSKVRPKGSPINGMQGRPASGPVDCMNAFAKAAKLKGARVPAWLQAMYIDHYFAECVLVGGARRAARLACKFWKDESIIDFILVKRPLEFADLKGHEDVLKLRQERTANGLPPYNSFLWSANNSVLVDNEFWTLVNLKDKRDRRWGTPVHKHAKKVFRYVAECSYGDGTGEPGFINVDTFKHKDEGFKQVYTAAGDYIGSAKYQVEEDTNLYLSKIVKRVSTRKYKMIVNPCAEIQFVLTGAFCVIADNVPYFCNSLDEAEESFRATTRALIRTNLMPSIYDKEVKRTNRIGVGLTGIHEFAWKFFGFGFRDLLDEKLSQPFWQAIRRFHDAVVDEAKRYCAELGVVVPHTLFTVKPSGTTSKLFGLTEGWHLPSMRKYLRWVQFRHDDPLVQQYIRMGYPTRHLVKYEGTVVVGFPTAPLITTLGLGSALVTAAEATPEEQYKWLMLGEKYWIHGVQDDEGTPNSEYFGNQISYTLKYDPKRVSFKEFEQMLRHYQSKIRCCSVMPQEDTTSYEYQPEEPVSDERFAAIVAQIQAPPFADASLTEDIGREHLECAGGACPIDVRSGAKT